MVSNSTAETNFTKPGTDFLPHPCRVGTDLPVEAAAAWILVRLPVELAHGRGDLAGAQVLSGPVDARLQGVEHWVGRNSVDSVSPRVMNLKIADIPSNYQ